MYIYIWKYKELQGIYIYMEIKGSVGNMCRTMLEYSEYVWNYQEIYGIGMTK